MTGQQFEVVVREYHPALYRFALSLTLDGNDAADLVQQTFYLWATRGHQLRDASKLKAWLLKTLYREFLVGWRRQARFPHYEISIVEKDLPPVTASAVDAMDAQQAMKALMQLDEMHRVPLTLFYLEDYSYKEISQILDVPVGTVMSRLARGKDLIRNSLADRLKIGAPQIARPFEATTAAHGKA